MPMQTRIDRKKYVNGSSNSKGHLQNKKSMRDASSQRFISASATSEEKQQQDQNICPPYAAWRRQSPLSWSCRCRGRRTARGPACPPLPWDCLAWRAGGSWWACRAEPPAPSSRSYRRCSPPEADFTRGFKNVLDSGLQDSTRNHNQF